jgi:pimeloyl-ACP methyl ester carboxylesterase
MSAHAPPPATASGMTRSGVYYEVHGQSGPPLFLGFPVTASPGALPGAGGSPVGPRFLARLTDRYRVLVADYPSIGRSATVPPGEFTVDRVCADLLDVADSAGFTRFAWWGGTFGAIVGLLLATRTDRLSALVSAGWPPLGGPYAAMLQGTRLNAPNPPAHARAILRDPAQYAQWVTFYESLAGWPDEAAAVARITCPRLVAYGANAEADVAGIPLRPAATIRERRSQLEALGWQVVEVPDRDSALILDPETLVPVVRRFLDTVL